MGMSSQNTIIAPGGVLGSNMLHLLFRYGPCSIRVGPLQRCSITSCSLQQTIRRVGVVNLQGQIQFLPPGGLTHLMPLVPASYLTNTVDIYSWPHVPATAASNLQCEKSMLRRQLGSFFPLPYEDASYLEIDV